MKTYGRGWLWVALVALSGLLACSSGAGTSSTKGAQPEAVARAAQALVTTNQLSPTGSVAGPNVAFSWTATSDATWYAVWVTADGSNGLFYKLYQPSDVNCTGGTGTCTTAAATLPGGALSWYVDVEEPGGWAPWIGGMSFNVTGVPTLTQVSPSGSQSGSTVQFAWSAVSGAASYQVWVTADGSNGVYYKSYSPTDGGCSGGTGNCTTAAVSGLPSGSLAWYVQADSGAWIGPMNFNLQGALTQLSPTGSQGTATVPFSWSAVSGTTSYQVWVTVDGNTGVYYKSYAPSDVGCSSGGTCTTAAVSGLPAGPLAWYVQADSGGWIGADNFSIPTTQMSPLGPQSSDTVTFSWGAVTGATSYQVWATADGSNGIYYNTYTPSDVGCSSGSTCTTAAVSLPTGSLAWYVQVGATSNPWTGPANFTTP